MIWCKWPQKFYHRTSPADKQLQQSGQINSNKSVAFLYTNDKQAGEEIRGTIHFTIATDNIKYIGVTLTKQVKDLYDKNFKSSRKKLKKTSKTGETSYAHGLAELT